MKRTGKIPVLFLNFSVKLLTTVVIEIRYEYDESKDSEIIPKSRTEWMVDSMLDVILQLVDSQTAEEILKVNGFTEAELRQLGFDGD